MRLDGYVYILIHAAMPDLVKVGMTIRTSEVRAQEVSRETGVPGPYRVAYDEHFHDVIRAERAVHRKLGQHNEAGVPEHFRVSVKRTIRALREVKEEFAQQGELFSTSDPARGRFELKRLAQRLERASRERKIEQEKEVVLRKQLRRAAEMIDLDYDELLASLPSDTENSL